MPEMKKAKKLRIYKFAAEYNLSSELLVEFLNEKGFKIKSYMSLLNDDMIREIKAKFKKEMESSEKHYRRISEFNKKRIKRVEDQNIKDESVVEHKIADISQENVIEEEIKQEKEDLEKEKIVEEKIVEEPSEEKVEKEKEEPEEVTSEIIPEESEKFETETEKKLKNHKTGLTIVGKVELKEKSQKKGKSKKSKKQKKSEVIKQPAEQLSVQQNSQKEKSQPPELKKSETEQLSKKKKRKVLKAKKKALSLESKEKNKTKKRHKVKKFEIDKVEVEAAIKRTMLSIDESSIGDRASVRKKKRKEKKEKDEKIHELMEMENKVLKVTEFIAVNELANLMNVPVSEVIQKFIALGLMVSINQRLDYETISLVADEFGFEVELQKEYTADVLEDIEDDEDTLLPRSPVVTIMGHVDHGKTSLLDHIRQTNVVAGESGGITQHIGAYKVKLENGRSITFLDTPGHEAFTAMRARGAKVTDIVILIIAADDAVMPQTIEAINHAQAAGVPMIIVINKIDKPNANPEKIKQQLAERNVLVEEWGGKYQVVEISAKTGENIDELLEKIILEAELLELKANPNRHARGTIIEAQLDKGKGITATVLIEKGTLKIGEPFVAGNYHGRVRAMFNERGKKINEAVPSTPVLVSGFEGTPQAGDIFVVVGSEKEARSISSKRLQLKREQDNRQVNLITLDEIADQIKKGGVVKELVLIVKADVDGSAEALADSLMKLSNDEVSVNVIHKGVGAISESDVLLAAASNAVIIGFHVRPHVNARKLAEKEKVDIRLYLVIYDAINEIKSALEGMLEPIISEKLVATVQVRDIFKVPKIGTVAGCYVQDGKINKNNKIRLFRDNVVIYEGQLASLKRFKDDVKEVDAGYECGLNIANFNDIKVDDIIESYEIIETKKTID